MLAPWTVVCQQYLFNCLNFFIIYKSNSMAVIISSNETLGTTKLTLEQEYMCWLIWKPMAVDVGGTKQWKMTHNGHIDSTVQFSSFMVNSKGHAISLPCFLSETHITMMYIMIATESNVKVVSTGHALYAQVYGLRFLKLSQGGNMYGSYGSLVIVLMFSLTVLTLCKTCRTVGQYSDTCLHKLNGTQLHDI